MKLLILEPHIVSSSRRGLPLMHETSHDDRLNLVSRDCEKSVINKSATSIPDQRKPMPASSLLAIAAQQAGSARSKLRKRAPGPKARERSVAISLYNSARARARISRVGTRAHVRADHTPVAFNLYFGRSYVIYCCRPSVLSDCHSACRLRCKWDEPPSPPRCQQRACTVKRVSMQVRLSVSCTRSPPPPAPSPLGPLVFFHAKATFFFTRPHA
jgi:hypothetical protein